jgi:hypothetical protein
VHFAFQKKFVFLTKTRKNMSILNYVKTLFSRADEGSKNPLVHEIIIRSEQEQEQYKKWVNSPEKDSFLNFIKQQYELSKDGKEDQSMIRILDSSPSCGFMLRYPENFSVENFHHLFDYLKDRVLEMGYKPYMSDRKMYTSNDRAEMVERHHLKPPRDMKMYGKEKLDQMYGNISIELNKIDDVPTHIRFLCNNYSDSAFIPARDFDELMNKLCD